MDSYAIIDKKRSYLHVEWPEKLIGKWVIAEPDSQCVNSFAINIERGSYGGLHNQLAIYKSEKAAQKKIDAYVKEHNLQNHRFSAIQIQKDFPCLRINFTVGK